MNQNRIEPTFGTTPHLNTSSEAVTANAEATPQVGVSQKAPQKISLSTKVAPGFTFTQIQKPTNQPIEQVASAFSTEEPSQIETQTETVSSNDTVTPSATTASEKSNAPVAMNTAERVIPTSQSKDWKKPEEWKALNKVPSKFRRLVVVLVLLALLLGLFMWLKPNAPETVEELQMQQSNNLPIDFRPVNEEEARAVEARLAEEKAEAERKALEAQQQAQPAVDQNQTEVVPEVKPQVVEVVTPTQSVDVAPQPVVVAKTEAQSTQKAVRSEPSSAPKTQGSVIYQAEKVAKETVKPTVEKVKPAVVKAVVSKPEKAVEKTVEKVAEKAKAPVVAAKPVESRSADVASSRKLTVPAGVSLMQVFRNQNLNISDVNAMTKANGANKVLSSFKAGDSVNVKLDSNNRVVEMQLSSGGRFIRQTNGTYIYKK